MGELADKLKGNWNIVKGKLKQSMESWPTMVWLT